jgi:integrase
LDRARFDVHPWSKKGIETALQRAIYRSGLSQPDHTGGPGTRKEVKVSHGFRYFFETMLVNAGLQETVIRKLMGHSNKSNLTQLYSKQTENELLQEYMKAVDLLTINEENRLKRKVEKLEVEKSQNQALAIELEKVKRAVNL